MLSQSEISEVGEISEGNERVECDKGDQWSAGSEWDQSSESDEWSAWDEWNTAWMPDIRATLLFLVKDDEVLLIRKKRGIGAGKINAPGGKIDPGETPLECAVRETYEELGIRIHDAVERAHLAFSFTCKTVPDIDCRVFMATSFSGEPHETDEAVPLWTKCNAIPYDEMWEDDMYWLPLMLEGARLKARFIFTGEKLIARKVEVMG